MAHFEKVTKFKDVDIPMPTRATKYSAGYDLYVAEDIVIPPYEFMMDKMRDKLFVRDPRRDYYGFLNPLSLDDVANLTKELKAKPTLVPTGVKCQLEDNQYLALVPRSSLPLKHWLIIPNSPATIDADYYNNESNEGHIFIQVVNLAPFAIQLKKGDRIAQGIICAYGITDDDTAEDVRVGGFGSSGN